MRLPENSAEQSPPPETLPPIGAPPSPSLGSNEALLTTHAQPVPAERTAFRPAAGIVEADSGSETPPVTRSQATLAKAVGAVTSLGRTVKNVVANDNEPTRDAKPLNGTEAPTDATKPTGSDASNAGNGKPPENGRPHQPASEGDSDVPLYTKIRKGLEEVRDRSSVDHHVVRATNVLAAMPSEEELPTKASVAEIPETPEDHPDSHQADNVETPNTEAAETRQWPTDEEYIPITSLTADSGAPLTWEIPLNPYLGEERIQTHTAAVEKLMELAGVERIRVSQVPGNPGLRYNDGNHYSRNLVAGVVFLDGAQEEGATQTPPDSGREVEIQFNQNELGGVVGARAARYREGGKDGDKARTLAYADVINVALQEGLTTVAMRNQIAANTTTGSLVLNMFQLYLRSHTAAGRLVTVKED